MGIQHELGRPTWIEIDVNRLAGNIRRFREFLPGHVQIMAVVKADGYGHGALPVSEVALSEGASMLGVASLEEGAHLRQNRIAAPILILGYTDPRKNRLLLELDLLPTIFHWESAYSLSQQALGMGKRMPVHVKLDTGMGRLGLRNIRNAIGFLESVYNLPGITLKGVYTHFATADDHEDESFALEQLQRFEEILKACRDKGLDIKVKHAANTAAALKYPRSHLDMVRIGIGLYGCYPGNGVERSFVKLLPVMSFKSRIVFLKKVPAGTPISYGRSFITRGDTRIATVPLGYGDGYSRMFSNRGAMLVRGKKVPVAGRVCMDLTMLDVGKVPQVHKGDEVVVFGEQGGESILVDDLAEQLGTIHYEVLCSAGKRVPRFYLQSRTLERGIMEYNHFR